MHMHVVPTVLQLPSLLPINRGTRHKPSSQFRQYRPSQMQMKCDANNTQQQRKFTSRGIRIYHCYYQYIEVIIVTENTMQLHINNNYIQQHILRQ